MNERDLSRDIFEVLIQTLDVSACPTTDNWRVISFSLPDNEYVFTNSQLVAVKLPKLLNQQEWDTLDSLSA